MGMMRSGETLLRTMMRLVGGDNVIVIHRALVEFTGSLEAGMLLGQLLYWTGRGALKDGWVAKSDAELQRELCLSRYAVRQARERLERMGVVETRRAKWNGAPTTHYRLVIDRLLPEWEKFAEQAGIVQNEQLYEQSERLSDSEQSIVRNQTMDCPISDNPLSDFAQSITKNTSEITTSSSASKDADAAKPHHQVTSDASKRSDGGLTPTQRQVLALFGAKRFKTPAQAAALLALEREYGGEKLVAVAQWAAQKGMTLGQAITALPSALKRWGQAPQKQAGQSAVQQTEQQIASVEAIRKWLEE